MVSIANNFQEDFFQTNISYESSAILDLKNNIDAKKEDCIESISKIKKNKVKEIPTNPLKSNCWNCTSKPYKNNNNTTQIIFTKDINPKPFKMTQEKKSNNKIQPLEFDSLKDKSIDDHTIIEVNDSKNDKGFFSGMCQWNISTHIIKKSLLGSWTNQFSKSSSSTPITSPQKSLISKESIEFGFIDEVNKYDDSYFGNALLCFNLSPCNSQKHKKKSKLSIGISPQKSSKYEKNRLIQNSKNILKLQNINNVEYTFIEETCSTNEDFNIHEENNTFKNKKSIRKNKEIQPKIIDKNQFLYWNLLFSNSNSTSQIISSKESTQDSIVNNSKIETNKSKYKPNSLITSNIETENSNLTSTKDLKSNEMVKVLKDDKNLKNGNSKTNICIFWSPSPSNSIKSLPKQNYEESKNSKINAKTYIDSRDSSKNILNVQSNQEGVKKTKPEELSNISSHVENKLKNVEEISIKAILIIIVRHLQIIK